MSYGAIEAGHTIPFSSWDCSTEAAMMFAAGPAPIATSRFHVGAFQ